MGLCISANANSSSTGPCRVVNADKTVFHSESWNSNANIFFIDQPIGVGFSYADYGEYVSTTEEAAIDVAAFVCIFFTHSSEFQGRGFHMAGESAQGRYLPLFAAAIYEQNPLLVQAGLPPINLTSIMIAM
ncbi:Alpha/Beta hydrolase protein [Mycena crocata]|nr:Alpha/Beta hydrolase protein [Mycena crocata]